MTKDNHLARVRALADDEKIKAWVSNTKVRLGEPHQQVGVVLGVTGIQLEVVDCPLPGDGYSGPWQVMLTCGVSGERSDSAGGHAGTFNVWLAASEIERLDDAALSKLYRTRIAGALRETAQVMVAALLGSQAA